MSSPTHSVAPMLMPVSANCAAATSNSARASTCAFSFGGKVIFYHSFFGSALFCVGKG
jgi:hypothetical protein